MRLDRFLSEMNIATRSEGKKMIRAGRVLVNEKIVRDGSVKIDPAKDCVRLDQRAVVWQQYQYYMLNKPAGCITATEDRSQKTVMVYLPETARRDLAPVGRLDKDTEGLLLLTNDGALNHNLLAPGRHVKKTYQAKIRGKVTEREQALFVSGLDIGEKKKTAPAYLKILSSGEVSEIQVTITEGKFHQIKRMFQAVGMEVLFLKRLTMGSLKLDERLKPGECRMLTEEELAGLKKLPSDICNSGQNVLESMLEKKQAVIFDLDGTITDSMWVWEEIDREFFQSRHIPVPDTFPKDIEGMGFTETAEYFVRSFQIPESVDELKQIWTDMAIQKYREEVPLKPGIREFLDHLQKNQIKIGIATSNSRELLDVFLQARGLELYVDAVTTSCDVKKGKPAPDVYRKTAEKLGIVPSSCLAFEDIPMGILAGKNAGMEVCAVEDAYSAHLREEKKILADYYIEDYRQVIEHTYEVLK